MRSNCAGVVELFVSERSVTAARIRFESVTSGKASEYDDFFEIAACCHAVRRFAAPTYDAMPFSSASRSARSPSAMISARSGSRP